jgi:tRNA(fMet)-specific endonuclease VapC
VALKRLLDTSAYSELKRGNRVVAGLVRDSEHLYFSCVVAGELLYGFRRGGRYEQNWRELQQFIARPFVTLLDVTLTTADRFGRVARGLRNKGTPLPSNDIWIAAHAMECGAELVSLDQHFAQVDGLAWVLPGG